MSKKAYLFSGLGSDERVFKYLTLPPHVEIVVIRWEQPGENEDIADYAKRLCSQIEEPGGIYLGVSFGGIIAIEVDKHIKASKIVLLSSVKEAKELPGFFKVAGKLRFYKMANVKLIQKESRWLFNMYGVNGPEHQALLMALFRDLDPTFFKWAIKQMMLWRHEHDNNNVIHIHGSADKAFPFKQLKKVDYVVKDGGHFMVFDRVEELNPILEKAMI